MESEPNRSKIDIAVLRRELLYLVERFPVGVKMANGHLHELEELTIENNGSMTCYLRSIDDYYYVSNKVARDYNQSEPHWIDHLCFKNEGGTFILFKQYVLDKYRLIE